MNRIIKKISKIVLLVIMLMTMVFNMITFAGWTQDNGEYFYYDEQTKTYVTNNWVHTSYGYYYLDGQGKMVKGFYQINGKYYYFNTNGLMHTGFLELNEDLYYLNPNNGELVTGWIEVNDEGVIDYYYFGNNGKRVDGFQTINNYKYYFNEGKALLDTWAKINNNWYKFGVDAKIVTGWYNQDGKYYYMNPTDGSMVKGFVKDSQGNTYYLNETDGTLVINQTITINGNSYTFNNLGQLTSNTISSVTVPNVNVINPMSNGVQTSYSVASNQSSGVIVKIGVEPGSANATKGVTTAQINIERTTDLVEGLIEGPK